MLRALLIALVLLGVVGVGGVAWITLNPPADAPVVAGAPVAAPTAPYLVSARTLRAGTLIRAEDLAIVELEIGQAPAGARRDSREARAEATGSMVRRTLPPGEVIRGEDVMRPGERGFLAAVLGPDMRAVSISVDAVTGTAGLIWPGDRVDLLLSQQLNDDAIPVYRRVMAETVMTNVRVIAIDQALVQGAVGEAPDVNRQSRTVTIEVSNRQAELAAVATRLGRLSLIVRSATEHAQVEELDSLGTKVATASAQRALEPAMQMSGSMASGPVLGGDVSPGLRQGRPTSAAPHNVEIFHGATRREEFRF